MKHSVKASVAFDFKGERFAAEVLVDIAHFLQSGQVMEQLFIDLGRVIGLDEYRHEFDVMTCQDIHFSDAVGLATDYVADGAMDWSGLEKTWQAQVDLRATQHIANKYFNVENLDDHPKLAAALLAAYSCGSEGAAEHKLSKQGLNEGFYG